MNRKLSACRLPLLALAVSFLSLFQAQAQCKPPANQTPPLSPAAQASVTLNGKSVTVDYCTPSLKGRQIGKEIVPYDKVWRTGANTATTLKTETNLRIGNLSVPAGTYTLYTLPSAQGWKLIVNKQTGQWGTVYNEAQDLGRVEMRQVAMTSPPVETFKISFENTAGKKTELHLIWGNTNVFVPIAATD
ncbi:MAG TPA: DUF2911 domain-containing protein [Silvibacterium sp.]|nr:DUF2911 domain-containing protein [Silvibacterium sp.]